MEEPIVSRLREHWEDLLREGQGLGFKAGQVIAYEGHDPYGLFVILEGKVKFSKAGISCQEGHLWRAPKGMVVGLEPFFRQTPFCCTCTAGEDCRVTFISKTQLLPFKELHEKKRGE